MGRGTAANAAIMLHLVDKQGKVRENLICAGTYMM
jgi:hypothetical protein